MLACSIFVYLHVSAAQRRCDKESRAIQIKCAPSCGLTSATRLHFNASNWFCSPTLRLLFLAEALTCCVAPLRVGGRSSAGNLVTWCKRVTRKLSYVWALLALLAGDRCLYTVTEQFANRTNSYSRLFLFLSPFPGVTCAESPGILSAKD